MKKENDVTSSLTIDFKEVKDEELLSQVVAKLVAICTIDKVYKLSIEEDTAYYLYLVLCALAEGGYYKYIQTAYSEKTAEAFLVINAKEYAKLFQETNEKLIKEIQEVKGIFKGNKRRKLIRNYTIEFKKNWENLDNEKPLVPTYINPYLKTKVIPILDKYKID